MVATGASNSDPTTANGGLAPSPSTPRHPDTSTPSPSTSTPSLSDLDRSLLTAITSPGADSDALLAKLDPADLAAWLERPEIQAAIAAARELRDTRLHFQLAAATSLALERLTAVLAASKNLDDPGERTETRRAASAILRLSALRHRPAPAPSSPCWGGGGGGRAGGVAAGGGSVSPPSTNAPFSQRSPAHRPVPSPRSAQHAAPSRQTVPDDPPPLDTSTPDAALATILAALRSFPSDSPRAAVEFVRHGIDRELLSHPILHDRFLVALSNSPILTARHRPCRVDPLARDETTASFRLAHTLDDGATAAAIVRLKRNHSLCSLHLVRQIESITPADTS